MIEAANGGNDLVIASVNFSLPSNVERLTLTGTAALNGVGNELANVIVGNAGDNILTGYGGDDIIDGGAGNDMVVVNSLPSQTSVSFQGATVVVTGSEGRDTLTNVERLQYSGVSQVVFAKAAPIGALYVAWGGRDATVSELAYWANRVDQGYATLDGVKAAILADQLGIAHTNAVVTELYQDYGGRAPTGNELAVWRGQIAGGASFDAVRQAILHDPLGATAVAVSQVYTDYMGRAPSDGELGVWQAQIKGGATLATVRGAVLDSADGLAHTDATVAQLYQDYAGRAPGADEIRTWEGLVRGGYSFGQVRTTILDDRIGQTHTGNTVIALYQDEFGRMPSVDEVTTWKGLIRGGATFDTLLDTLMSDRGSDATGTQRVAGTAGVDAFTASHGHDTVISGFDVARDGLTLSKGDVASGNVLDSAHAHQLFALDGTADVLLTLDDKSYILLQHTSLADLSAANIHLA